MGFCPSDSYIAFLIILFFQVGWKQNNEWNIFQKDYHFSEDYFLHMQGSFLISYSPRNQCLDYVTNRKEILYVENVDYTIIGQKNPQAE